MFDQRRWPNMVIHHFEGHSGVSRFSAQEIKRRHDLVKAELAHMEADALMVQGHFPPATMGCHTRLYWLSGFNGFRNTVTLVLPREGELAIVPGVKTSSNDSSKDPYVEAGNLLPQLAGVRRLAYAGLGYISHQLYIYLTENIPGLEIVDFSPQIEHMMAVKSAEEIEAIRDTCAIQDRVFAAASTYLYPGRNATDITADITRLLQLLGADPTLMPKILIQIAPNGPAEPGFQGMLDDRFYRIKDTDYVRLCLETPGSGGYYAERARYFFFDTPHTEMLGLWAEALELHDYQLSLYRPGATMQELREKINAYKASIGAETMTGHGIFDAEIRGMGMLTVDRPQIQYAWEDFLLEPGMAFVSMAWIKRGIQMCNVYDMCVVTDAEPHQPWEFPLELVVL
jgi:Xaa-Pro aminopeptidase